MANDSNAVVEVDPFDLADLSPVAPLPRPENKFLVEDQAGKISTIFPGQYDAYGPTTISFMEGEEIGETWLLRLKDGRWVEITRWIDMEEVAMTGRWPTEGIIEGRYSFVDERHALLWMLRNNIDVPDGFRAQLEGMSLLNHLNEAETAPAKTPESHKGRSSNSAPPDDESDGTIQDGLIWLKGARYSLTPGLRDLLSFFLSRPGVEKTEAVHHFGFQETSHLEKRVADLNKRLKKELRTADYSLRFEARNRCIYPRWTPKSQPTKPLPILSPTVGDCRRN